MAQNLSEPADVIAPAPHADAYFSTQRLKSGLGARTARGGVVTVASQSFKFVAGMAATVVLARLLTPADYGLVGMVAVVTGFVALFKDLGLSAATVQREEITPAQVSTLFWVNVALSVGVGLLTAAVSPAVAWFYGEPRLRAVTVAYAFGFLVGGLTVQHEALLRRQMRFAALAAGEIMALLASIAVTVVLAWRGAGYWALVGGHLTLGFVYMACVWVACGWRPGAPVRYAGVRPMLRFGGNLTGFGVINYFARTLDNLLIGRVWGSFQLGLYAKAYQLLLLPIDQINSPITSVAVPALSRLADEPERYRQSYLRLLEKVALLTMPLVAFMIGTSDWVVRLVLGPQWSGAAWIFTLLGVAGLLQPVANTTGWLFITQGRAREMFQWGGIGGTIMIAAIVAGVPWGAFGVAASYSAVFTFVVTPLLFWFVGRRGPVRASDFYRTVAPVAAASLGALAAVLLLRREVAFTSPLAGLAASFVLSFVVALAVMLALPRGRRALADVRRTFEMLVRRGHGE